MSALTVGLDSNLLIKPTEICATCPLFASGKGFVPPSGIGDVLIVGEAAGADEEQAGIGFVGKSGQYLFSQLKRINIEREQFSLANVCACRPLNNALAGEPFELDAIRHCEPIRARAIEAHKAHCTSRGLHPVILALGKTAFRTLLYLPVNSPILREDYYGYVHRSSKYGVWVIGAPHPAFLVRGQHKYLKVLHFCAMRALEVARGGFEYDKPTLHCDPDPMFFSHWVDRYLLALAADPSQTYLSIDIETPKKALNAEDKILREDEDDYTILRCSFAYQVGEAVSIPWEIEYIPSIERILGQRTNQLVLWNAGYDIPRLSCQITVNGTICDGMLWWHVLNSSLDKGLGFVTPYYWQAASMWKHLADERPAYYNAVDALAALRNTLGIKQHLMEAGQWSVVENHVIRLQQVLTYMSSKGLPLDRELRTSTELDFSVMLMKLHTQIQNAVPLGARRLKVFKKAPKVDAAELVRTEGLRKTSQCPHCGALDAKAEHFKSIGKKRLSKGEVENPCIGLKAIKIDVPALLWAQPLPWKVSNKGLQSYAHLKQHQMIIDRRKGRATFDDVALRQLKRKYPSDLLYPLITEQRRYTKLLGTYVGVTGSNGKIRGGLRAGPDGRIRPEFTMNPETLRLSCQNPNIQQLPRTLKPDDPETIIRNLIVAGVGCLLYEFDYAAIEAVLSAYFAQWRDGIRLAKLGVHAYLASHVLGRPADLSWPDGGLAEYFKEIKKSSDPAVQKIYNACKRTIHLSNYGGTPHKMVMVEQETFPDITYAKRLQDTYFDVAAPIRKWQIQTQQLADTQGFLINPYGYKLDLPHVFQWVLKNGEWVRQPGDDANAALAFLPQSTAAGILKDAMLRLYFNRFEEAGQYLRFTIHDSLLCEVPREQAGRVKAIMREEMTRPIAELPLPVDYGMGSNLVVDVDAKIGERWGELS